MFSNLYKSDFIEIFILMLGSFLIGYFFAFYYFKNKLDSVNSNLAVQNFDEQLVITDEGNIKAKKTFERGGKEVAGIRQKKIEFSDTEGEPVLKKSIIKTTKKTPKKD